MLHSKEKIILSLENQRIFPIPITILVLWRSLNLNKVRDQSDHQIINFVTPKLKKVMLNLSYKIQRFKGIQGCQITSIAKEMNQVNLEIRVLREKPKRIRLTSIHHLDQPTKNWDQIWKQHNKLSFQILNLQLLQAMTTLSFSIWPTKKMIQKQFQIVILIWRGAREWGLLLCLKSFRTKPIMPK